MLQVQTPLSKPYSDIRIKEEEQNSEFVSPPAPGWVPTAQEDPVALDIDPELMDSLQRTTKRAKRNRKGEVVTKSFTRKENTAANLHSSATSASVAQNNIPDVEMKDEPTPEEEDPTMPPQGPAFDFSQLAPGQTLEREQLLVLSTEDFDSYMERLRSSRELTVEEIAELKLIRRRIRNRESARESRSNKKDYVERLQARVETLKTHNKQLSLQIHGMQSENQSLKDEVIYLQDMIKKTPALENLFNAFLYISTNSQAGLSESSSITNPAAPSSTMTAMPSESSMAPTTINVNSFLDTSGQE